MSLLSFQIKLKQSHLGRLWLSLQTKKPEEVTTLLVWLIMCKKLKLLEIHT